MRKMSTSILLATLLVAVLAFTVFSQATDTDEDVDAELTTEAAAKAAAIQILQGGVSQKIPVNITMLVPTDSGVQTVTVPLQLNLDLTVGPVDAVELNVSVDSPSQFVSPVMVLEPTPAADTAITSTDTITTSDTITASETITASDAITE